MNECGSMDAIFFCGFERERERECVCVLDLKTEEEELWSQYRKGVRENEL